MKEVNESELQNGPDRDQRDAAEDPWCYVTIQQMRVDLWNAGSKQQDPVKQTTSKCSAL